MMQMMIHWASTRQLGPLCCFKISRGQVCCLKSELKPRFPIQSVADDGANYTSLLYANGPGHRDRGNLTFSNEEANQFEYRQVHDTYLKSFYHFTYWFNRSFGNCRMKPQALTWQDAGVPLKDETHGGEDVALFAKGPHSYLFAGVLEQR